VEWDSWGKALARRTLNEKRNNVTQNIQKQEINGTWCCPDCIASCISCLHKHLPVANSHILPHPRSTTTTDWIADDDVLKQTTGMVLKSFAQVENMIKDKRKRGPLFRHFMLNGLKPMVGAEVFKKEILSGASKISEVVTIVDETMANLIYENYWGSWYDKHHEEEEVRPTPYTKTEGTKHGVWNDKGLTRFNELFKEVKRDRESAAGKKLEADFQREMRDKVGGRKRRRVVTPSTVRAVSELSDVSDSEDEEAVGGGDQ